MAKSRTSKEELQRRKIGDLMRRWLDFLHMEEYDLHVLFPSDPDWEQPSEDGFSVRRIYPYKLVYLHVSQTNLDRLHVAPENASQSLLHEALHVLLWDYTHRAESRYVTQDELVNAEESLVSHLETVIGDLCRQVK